MTSPAKIATCGGGPGRGFTVGYMTNTRSEERALAAIEEHKRICPDWQVDDEED